MTSSMSHGNRWWSTVSKLSLGTMTVLSFQVDTLLFWWSGPRDTRPGPTTRNNDTCVCKTHTEVRIIIFWSPIFHPLSWSGRVKVFVSTPVFHPVSPVQFPPFPPSLYSFHLSLSTLPYRPVLTGKSFLRKQIFRESKKIQVEEGFLTPWHDDSVEGEAEKFDSIRQLVNLSDFQP